MFKQSIRSISFIAILSALTSPDALIGSTGYVFEANHSQLTLKTPQGFAHVFTPNTKTTLSTATHGEIANAIKLISVSESGGVEIEGTNQQCFDPISIHTNEALSLKSLVASCLNVKASKLLTHTLTINRTEQFLVNNWSHELGRLNLQNGHYRVGERFNISQDGMLNANDNLKLEFRMMNNLGRIRAKDLTIHLEREVFLGEIVGTNLIMDLEESVDPKFVWKFSNLVFGTILDKDNNDLKVKIQDFKNAEKTPDYRSQKEQGLITLTPLLKMLPPSSKGRSDLKGYQGFHLGSKWIYAPDELITGQIGLKNAQIKCVIALHKKLNKRPGRESFALKANDKSDFRQKFIIPLLVKETHQAVCGYGYVFQNFDIIEFFPDSVEPENNQDPSQEKLSSLLLKFKKVWIHERKSSVTKL